MMKHALGMRNTLVLSSLYNPKGGKKNLRCLSEIEKERDNNTLHRLPSQQMWQAPTPTLGPVLDQYVRVGFF